MFRTPLTSVVPPKRKNPSWANMILTCELASGTLAACCAITCTVAWAGITALTVSVAPSAGTTLLLNVRKPAKPRGSKARRVNGRPVTTEDLDLSVRCRGSIHKCDTTGDYACAWENYRDRDYLSIASHSAVDIREDAAIARMMSAHRKCAYWNVGDGHP